MNYKKPKLSYEKHDARKLSLSLSLIVIESNVEKTWKTTQKPPEKRKKGKKRANPETELPDTKNELPDTKVELPKSMMRGTKKNH